MSVIQKLLQSPASYAPIILRVPIGIILMAHGAQKLFGWFGGHGLEGTSKFMASLGLEPAMLMAFLAGAGEFFGGLFLLLGLLTRPSAFVVVITMIVAIFSVHFKNGLFLSNGGYEFGLALLAMSVSLVISGAGRISLDNLLADKFKR